MDAPQEAEECGKPASPWRFDGTAFDRLTLDAGWGDRPADQAQKLRVHRTTVSRAKDNETFPSAVEMLRWADELGCSVEDFHRKVDAP